MPKIDIYVDGSFSPTKQMYGCGIVILKDGVVDKEFSVPGTEKAYNKHHNAAGEVFAAMLAFQYVKDHYSDPQVTCYHDLEGLEFWTTGKWHAYTSLSIAYRDAVAALPFKVEFKKVKAHTGNTYNERADHLARKAAGLD